MLEANGTIDWLICEGRLLADDAAILKGYALRMREAGIPLDRVNVAQRFANPLLVARGTIWTETETQAYTVSREMLATAAFKDSPFDYIQQHRVTLRKKLDQVDRAVDHATYVERAEAGATEFMAFVLEFSDGSTHSSSFTTREPGGFTDRQAAAIEATRHALAAALEPISMRWSSASLLTTYLGDGPAASVLNGTIQRGENWEREAVVMISDLRGFTAMSDNWPPQEVLHALDHYFEAVVKAVHSAGGDVLKFMGDGILSIFPTDEFDSRSRCCDAAISAANAAVDALFAVNQKRLATSRSPLEMGIGLDLGPVTYGNIGTLERLDFTVLGGAVNVASRVQDLCKVIGVPILMTGRLKDLSTLRLEDKGTHNVRGVSTDIDVYTVLNSRLPAASF